MRKLSDADFISYIRCYDLILLSEIWTSKKHTTDLEIQGYETFIYLDIKAQELERAAIVAV